jgi:hypothetical protein
MDLSNMFDYLVIGIAAAIIWKFLTKDRSSSVELKALKEDAENIVAVNIYEVIDEKSNMRSYLVHKSLNKEFLFQTATLESILPKLKEKFVDTPIMFISDDHRLLAMFTMNETKK